MNKLFLAAMFSALAFVSSAKAEVENCTEIVALPTVIAAQGTYCLKQNLNVNLDNGAAITVNAGNVTIEFNGWRINNQAAAATTLANGVFAQNRKNVTLRNGFLRGFYRGVFLEETVADASAGHLVEQMKIGDSTRDGMRIAGDFSLVRNNRVTNTGGNSSTAAIGIFIESANDSVVSGNIVSGVTETIFVQGIRINVSDRTHVVENVISAISGSADNIGIIIDTSDQVTVAGNRLLNDAGSGEIGMGDILNNSTELSCLDNDIGGYVTSRDNCDVDDGNRVLYN